MARHDIPERLGFSFHPLRVPHLMLLLARPQVMAGPAPHEPLCWPCFVSARWDLPLQTRVLCGIGSICPLGEEWMCPQRGSCWLPRQESLSSGKCLCQGCTQAPMPTPGAGLGTQRSPVEPDLFLLCRLQAAATRAGVCKTVKG